VANLCSDGSNVSRMPYPLRARQRWILRTGTLPVCPSLPFVASIWPWTRALPPTPGPNLPDCAIFLTEQSGPSMEGEMLSVGIHGSVVVLSDAFEPEKLECTIESVHADSGVNAVQSATYISERREHKPFGHQACSPCCGRASLWRVFRLPC
jgi:hypothetical protein